MTKNEELELTVASQEEQQEASQADTSDEPSIPAPEAESDAASQADEAQGEDEGADNGDTSESDADDDDDAMVPLAKLKKVRNEAKNLRDRLKAAEDRVAELERSTSDSALVAERDALKAQVEKLTADLTSERLRTHALAAAEQHGAIEPAVVARLIDVNAVSWEDGKPTNLAEVIAAMKSDYPRLFAAAQGTGNTGNRSEPRGQDETLSPSARLANAFRSRT